MKRILSLLLIAFMAIGVNAGNDKKTVTSAPYKVGDYYNDGVKEGVVFVVYDGGYHGKIVSVDESRELWVWETVRENVTAAISKGNGMGNMNKVKKLPDWKNNYPAFAWCASLGDGWYLPAKQELLTIYNNKTAIDANLTDVLGTYTYWSSTESDGQSSSGVFCAWLVYMNRGYAANSSKYDGSYVRAVSAF